MSQALSNVFKLHDVINIKDPAFGAKGDGVNDTAALTSFFAAVNGNIGLLPAGTYRATSLINLASLTNAHIIGVPGATTIVSDNDNEILRMSTVTNVIFEGIKFLSEKSTGGSGRGVVFGPQNSIWKNVTFRNCRFSCPNTDVGHALFIGPRTLSGDTAGSVRGLFIQDCEFEDCGHIAITLMNRGTAADKYEAFRDVHITGCSSLNTGINGTHGFFVTLDGTGSGFEIRNNYVRKASVTGIENTGWINGVIDNNTFGDFSRSYKPLSNSTVNDIMTGVTISNNRTLVPAPLASVFYDMNQCVIENNRIEVDGDGAAAFVRDANDNRFRNNIWRNLNTTATGFYALLISSATRNCHRNVFVDETFDHSTVGNGFAALRFSGANCKFNSVIRPRVALAAAGQFFDQTSSADENWVQHMYRFQNNDLWNVEHVTRNFTSDANITLIIVDYSARIIQMTDTGVLLTAGRDVILPKFERTWVVRNGTAQILTFKASTGTGIAVAAGNVATIYWDGTNMKRATADVVA